MSLNSNKSLPYPFYYAKGWYGVELFEADIKYITDVIMNDKIWRLITQADNKWDYISMQSSLKGMETEKFGNGVSVSIEHGGWMLFIKTCNEILFFEKFLDDPNCPKRLKYFLWQYIGNTLGYIKFNDVYNNYLQHSFLTERWQEICR